MFGDNKSNTPLPVFVDQNLFQYPVNATNQLQLFGNNALNYFDMENNPTLWHHQTEAIPSQQNLQISLNNTINHAEIHQIATIPNRNHVSTGLKLSYDDEERNSSVTSASGSMATDSSIILSLSDNLRTVVDRQKDDIDHYLKTQEEKLVEGIRDIEKRQINSLLNAIEIKVNKKLHEKDLELENMKMKTMELAERTKQIGNEAQQWCYRAKYNESVVNILKTNLQEAMHQQQHAIGNQGKEEGYGDSADSCIDPKNYLNGFGSGSGSGSGKSGNMVCRSCEENEVSILLLPCKHLCLCKDCEGLFNVCPVCHLITTHTVPVYLS